ncbi:poly-gamma-glutamate synthesis protein (capsule biosynthesis protein) [Paenibacillus castaneae]|uniref:CapA family protein n=1 Tax=Paenibacillus castaneae TaxID=474957 RepID=UPI000C9CE69B|nr:CapA family protein [Paenibacillus castaneae]NIK77680.1 poly-gamma-glutamate synthesis protein (capsule biosynthesis protein) [Paenibacillus castaneae]
MRRKRHRKTNTLLLLLSLIGLVIIFLMPSVTERASSPAETETAATASPAPDDQPVFSPTPPSQEPIQTEPSHAPPQPEYADAVWIAVGDVMMHTPQLPGAYDKQTNRYNFDPFFEEVKPILQQGDWVIANLETPIAGVEFGYTGYPTFNAPTELAEALKNAGFNFLTNANNHSLDKGERGILQTIKNLKSLDFKPIGTASSQEEADSLTLSEKNGIVMGLAAYTYGTNGIPLPDGKPYLVSLINEQKIKDDIKRLRDAGADFVAISLHFGTEYQLKPNDEQKRLARSLIAAGADIIAGSHPHVVQPYEVLETTDQNGHARKGLIIYSMGNFISNQRGETKDYGVIFKVSIRKNMSDGTIDFTEIESIPTWVHRYKPDNSYRYRILPVEETLADAKDTLLTKADYEMLKKDSVLLRNRLDSMK